MLSAKLEPAKDPQDPLLFHLLLGILEIVVPVDFLRLYAPKYLNRQASTGTYLKKKHWLKHIFGNGQYLGHHSKSGEQRARFQTNIYVHQRYLSFLLSIQLVVLIISRIQERNKIMLCLSTAQYVMTQIITNIVSCHQDACTIR